jgi:hypothetical protein
MRWPMLPGQSHLSVHTHTSPSSTSWQCARALTHTRHPWHAQHPTLDGYLWVSGWAASRVLCSLPSLACQSRAARHTWDAPKTYLVITQYASTHARRGPRSPASSLARREGADEHTTPVPRRPATALAPAGRWLDRCLVLSLACHTRTRPSGTRP